MWAATTRIESWKRKCEYVTAFCCRVTVKRWIGELKWMGIVLGCTLWPVGAVKLFLHCLSISGPASISHAWNYLVVSMWRGVVLILDPWWIHLVIFSLYNYSLCPHEHGYMPGSLSSHVFQNFVHYNDHNFYFYIYRLQFLFVCLFVII